MRVFIQITSNVAINNTYLPLAAFAFIAATFLIVIVWFLKRVGLALWLSWLLLWVLLWLFLLWVLVFVVLLLLVLVAILLLSCWGVSHGSTP